MVTTDVVVKKFGAKKAKELQDNITITNIITTTQN
jgi:hypothetical protein